MDEQILSTIKKLLGFHEEDTSFDTDVKIGINSAISALTQMGVGPQDGFSITGNTEKWSDFLGDVKVLENVKSYIHISTRLLVDPPSLSFVISALKDEQKEIAWRITIATDPKDPSDVY